MHSSSSLILPDYLVVQARKLSMRMERSPLTAGPAATFPVHPILRLLSSPTEARETKGIDITLEKSPKAYEEKGRREHEAS